MELIKPEFFEVPTGQDAPTTISEAVEGLPIIASYGGTGTGENYWIERFTQIDASTYSGIFNGRKHYFNRSGQCTDAGFTDYTVKRVNANSDYGTGTSPTSGESSTDQSTATVSSLLPVDYFAQQALNGMLQNIERPFELVDADINKLTTIAYKMAKSMIMVSARERSADPTSSGSSSASSVNINPDTFSDNTERLLNNIVAALEKTDGSINITSGGTTTSVAAERITNPELNAKMDSLITAVGGIGSGSGSSSSSATTDFTSLIAALKGTGDATVSASIGSLGTTNNPFNVECTYSFPSSDAITKSYNNETAYYFLTFGNDVQSAANKVLGITSLLNLARIVISQIVDVQNDTVLDGKMLHLAAKVFGRASDVGTSSVSAVSNTLETLWSALATKNSSAINNLLDNRIKAWLAQTKDGNNQNVTYPNSL